MELEDHVSDTAATASAHRIVRIQSGYKKVEIEIGHCTVDSPSPLPLHEISALTGILLRLGYK